MNEDAGAINSKEGLVRFLRELSEDSVANKDEWENWTLEHYLESISAFLNDDGLNAPYKFDGLPERVDENQNWSLIARLFLAGKYYE